jgi:ATP-dependent DNA helicase RecG
MMTFEALATWMTAPTETEHLEFKEARNQFDTTKLVNYCCALANECGGYLVLGVTDHWPRRVVGTTAFGNLPEIKLTLLQKLRLRVEVNELAHPDGLVLVFTVPSRAIGMPIATNGTYWMRAGESLVAMPPDHLQRIFAEGVPDFSASICTAATMVDLAPQAIERFRGLWETRQPARGLRSAEQLLEDAELLDHGALTYAALVLLGTARSLSRHLGCAEIIFEYRNDEAVIAYAQRVELRDAFLLNDDELWRLVNLRNTVHSFVDGLFRRDIPTFNERAFREAVLNAVCHRDYRLGGSTFIKQWPSRVEITSPGGFPPGITVDNILSKQSPRNRRLAEAFGKCGLVERSGQGADLLFETAVREGRCRSTTAARMPTRSSSRCMAAWRTGDSCGSSSKRHGTRARRSVHTNWSCSTPYVDNTRFPRSRELRLHGSSSSG